MENNSASITLLTVIFYIIIGGIFAPFSILFLGHIDWVILISTGLINKFLLFRFLKLKFLRSLTAGFLIASISLILMYLLFFLTSFENITIGLFLFLLCSILMLCFINYKNWKFSSPIRLFLLTISTILCFLVALNLKNYYPNESRNLRIYSFTIIDSFKRPVVGDSIEVSVLRQPMLNIQETYVIKKIVTDNKGKFETSLSESTKYQVRVYNDENWMRGVYEIDYSDLKNKNDIVLEIDE
ncbi:MAG: hypothetical protein WDA08_05865 [Weeksellaceae bacterium]